MIGTTAAILGAAAIGAVGAVATGVMGANAANQAATTQANAADRAYQLSDAQFQQSRTDALPWIEQGRRALEQYSGELGLSTTGADGKPFKSEFTTTPGYDFAVKEGEKGVVGNLAALGMKGSGAALKALTRFRQGLADQTYSNYLTRLDNMATGGQQAQQQLSTAGSSNVINLGNSLADSAAARASGYIGSTNALTGAIGGIANTAGNALGWASGNKGWATA
ncbi:MAG: hypothetical protein JWM16_6355 [Verrucomicrobiales bacterium]|nr:hypothetical protein [Verrucomicrobiales bacterium]